MLTCAGGQLYTKTGPKEYTVVNMQKLNENQEYLFTFLEAPKGDPEDTYQYRNIQCPKLDGDLFKYQEQQGNSVWIMKMYTA